ncbi:MAG: hypothetical protein IT160_04050 [Bryobacterales bacterium]|nr:hypothetical protein [Bryobacterales bacterium]
MAINASAAATFISPDVISPRAARDLMAGAPGRVGGRASLRGCREGLERTPEPKTKPEWNVLMSLTVRMILNRHFSLDIRLDQSYILITLRSL